MSCGSIIAEIVKRLMANDSTQRFEAYTDWMLVVGIDNFQLILKRHAVTHTGGDFTFTGAVQMAAVRTDKPGSWATAGSSYNNEGDDGTGTITLSGASTMFFIRFGVAYQLTNGATYGEADVGLTVAFDQCGELAGSFTTQIQTTSTVPAVVPITDWMPFCHVATGRFAVMFTSQSGPIELQLTSQTAPAVVTENPSAWSSTFDNHGAKEIDSIIVTNGGSGYVGVPTVGFTGGGGSGAAATAVLDGGGHVASVTITNPGSGYTSTPAVTFTPTNQGSGAAATAHVDTDFRTAGEFNTGDLTPSSNSDFWIRFGIRYVLAQTQFPSLGYATVTVLTATRPPAAAYP